MTTVITKEKTKVAVSNSSVLEKVRNGIPLYEIAGGFGISTAAASEMMDQELLYEKKKIEAVHKRAVVVLHEQNIIPEKISIELNLPLSFVHKVIIQHTNKSKKSEKLAVYKKEKYAEENPNEKNTLTNNEREHRDHAVINAYKSGEEITVIAQRLFLKPGMVYFILRQNGLAKMSK